MSIHQLEHKCIGNICLWIGSRCVFFYKYICATRQHMTTRCSRVCALHNESVCTYIKPLVYSRIFIEYTTQAHVLYTMMNDTICANTYGCKYMRVCATVNGNASQTIHFSYKNMLYNRNTFIHVCVICRYISIAHFFFLH